MFIVLLYKLGRFGWFSCAIVLQYNTWVLIWSIGRVVGQCQVCVLFVALFTNLLIMKLNKCPFGHQCIIKIILDLSPFFFSTGLLAEQQIDLVSHFSGW